MALSSEMLIEVRRIHDYNIIDMKDKNHLPLQAIYTVNK